MSEELLSLTEEGMAEAELTKEEVDELERRPWHERHPFMPPTRRDELTLGLILAYERCYAESENPVFALLAHRARSLLRLPLTPEESAARFGWIDAYFARVARRMTKLVEEPPGARDAAVAGALGFERAKPGPASSEFDDAKRSMRDIRIGVVVELLLPANGGKVTETCKQVSAILGKSKEGSGTSVSTVSKAYRWYRRLKGN